MKKFKLIHHIVLISSLMMFFCIILSSCKKDSSKGNPPVITRIRAISPAPNDSVLTKVLPGQLVVVQGSNFKDVTAIYFSGIKASFNGALVADDNLVVTVPSSIDFTKIPAGMGNTIRMVTKNGETTFNFSVSPPPPIVNSMSYEYAAPGSTVTLYGQYLYLINKISFTGGDATNIVSSADGTSVTLTIPLTAVTGNIVVDAQGGKFSYVAYNDNVNGMICNFDNINSNYGGNATLRSDPTLFPGNMGTYAEITTTTAMGGFSYNQGPGRSIILNPFQWVPEANLQDPIANYVLKFEANVNKPWSGGTVMIRRDESSWQFLARYEPWKTIPNLTFTSNGWITVVIPLTNFKTKTNLGEGTGLFAANLTTLINATGKRGMAFMLINDQSVAATTPLDIAIDNIRIVKVKK